MPQNKPWRATPDEWFHFDLVLGHSYDLLPVVCNPEAPLSPDSKMKVLGKTPSQYNSNRQVVGLSNWTKRQINDANIERWGKESDYGICSRMGNGWLALDCDIESPEIQDDVLRYCSSISVRCRRVGTGLTAINACICWP